AGDYKLVLAPANHAPIERRLELRIGPAHEATANDRLRASAEKALGSGEELGRRMEPDARQTALPKYEEALVFWRRIGDRYGEAETLRHVAVARYDRGEMPQARSAFEQALELWGHLDDRSGETSCLSGLGLVSTDTGDNKKASAYATRALQIAQEVGDRRGEAAALAVLGSIAGMSGESKKASEAFLQELELSRAAG